MRITGIPEGRVRAKVILVFHEATEESEGVPSLPAVRGGA